MQYLADRTIFDDIYEMYYNLFLELNFGVDPNGYLFDMDTGVTLRYKDKYIKPAITPVPVYAGAYDIVFEPSQNYNLMVTILGYYIDKEANNENNIGFIAQYIEENNNPDDRMQRVVVKTKNGNIASRFYHNIFLSYIDIIFILSGNLSYDLSNFDILI